VKTKQRLRLRPIELGDVDHVMTWVNDPEVVKNFQHFNKRFTRRDEAAFIRKLLRDKNSFTFSIFRRSDGAYIGQCAINQISWENRLGRMAMTIRKDHWGQGYASEATELLLARAFRRLKLNKVWAMVYASNKKGLHVDVKAGFKKESLLRAEYCWRGKFHDIVRIGILKKDFLRTRGRTR
jgi:RimJ/RimL family protein N-acetyltransferase